MITGAGSLHTTTVQLVWRDFTIQLSCFVTQTYLIQVIDMIAGFLEIQRAFLHLCETDYDRNHLAGYTSHIRICGDHPFA